MTFANAVAFTVAMEGGFSNDVEDPGGLTKWGISSKQYPEVLRSTFSREDAIGIYKRDYWDRCRCNNFPWEVALLVFDTAVNHGQGQAIRWLQTALNVRADGLVGDVTVKAAWAAKPEQLLEVLARRAVNYAEQKAFWHFGRGWMTRLFHLQQELAKHA